MIDMVWSVKGLNESDFCAPFSISVGLIGSVQHMQLAPLIALDNHIANELQVAKS